MKPVKEESYIDIYNIHTLSDLFCFKGSDWFAISDYSPPSELIMRELGVLISNILENDLSKFYKILGLTFFYTREDFEGFKTAYSIYLS